MPRRSTFSWSKATLAWLGAMLRLAVSIGVPFLVLGFASGYRASALIGFALGYAFFGAFLTAIFLCAVLPTSWLGGALAAAVTFYAFFSGLGAPILLALIAAVSAGAMGWVIDIGASRMGPVKAMGSVSMRGGVR